MDCRMAFMAALAIALNCSGCVLTQSQPEPSSVAEAPKAPPTKASAARLALAIGAMREKQAQDSDKNPEAQVKYREDARLAYQDTLRLDPNNLEALLGLAHIQAQTGNYDLAFDTYQKALPKHAKCALLWYDKGQCHNRKKDWPEAVKCFQKALDIEPENRQVLMTLGLTLARMGQEEQALVYLTRASSSALAHYNLARMQLHLGQSEQARVHLGIALRENPNLASARDLLVTIDGQASAPAQN